MPSPIGHALAGIAIAWAADSGERASQPPRATPGANTWTLTIVCAALAAAPDADLLVRGAHRTVTHSVAAAVLVTIVAAGVTGWVTGKIRWRVAWACGAAYASHLLLDWLGADPNLPSGIQLLWPSHRWFISPVTIFPGTERRHLLTIAAVETNLKALVVECVVVGPLVAAAWRRLRRTYRSRVPISAPDSRLRPSGAEAGTDGI